MTVKELDNYESYTDIAERYINNLKEQGSVNHTDYGKATDRTDAED